MDFLHWDQYPTRFVCLIFRKANTDTAFLEARHEVAGGDGLGCHRPG